MVWPRFLTDPLRGKASLAKAFWLYGLGSSVIYKIVGWIAEPQSHVGVVIYLLGGGALVS